MNRRLVRVLLIVLLVSLTVLAAYRAALRGQHRDQCTTHSASMSISVADTRMRVGDTLAVTVTLQNTGCAGLGLPQYRLYVDSAGGDVLVPSLLEPVQHYLKVDRGEADTVQFVLHAASVGEVTLKAAGSFEVHLGYPGPAYWGSAGSSALVVTVEP